MIHWLRHHNRLRSLGLVQLRVLLLRVHHLLLYWLLILLRHLLLVILRSHLHLGLSHRNLLGHHLHLRLHHAHLLLRHRLWNWHLRLCVVLLLRGHIRHLHLSWHVNRRLLVASAATRITSDLLLDSAIVVWSTKPESLSLPIH